MLLRANRKHSLKVRESAESHKKKRKKQSLTKEGRASVNMKTVSGSWSLHSKGGETTEGSSIASNEATVGISMAKGGETTEGSSIASNEATVGVSMILELIEIT